ncbi:YceD family protein [Calidifontibacter terrae]
MHLDPRNPLVLDTKELGRRPGQMAEIEKSVPAPDHLGNEVIEIAEGEPIALDLRIESVMEGVLITGSARATATGACVRCLDPVHEDVDVAFQELFAYSDRAAHHHEVAGEEDEDLRVLDGELADLELVLRDVVVTALPFQPVCEEDCPGLCSECGARLADDLDHHHDVVDPRWSALTGISGDAENDEKRN